MKEGRSISSTRNVRRQSESATAVIHQAIGALAPTPTTGEKPSLFVSSLRSLFEGEVPNLFDWYIGMASILLGSSMFLFNRYLTLDHITPYLVWLVPIRVSFIAAGISVLMLGFFQKERTGQYKSAHLLLSLTYLLFSLILWQTGEWDGGMLYGLTGLTIILILFLGSGGVIGFFVYVLLLLAVLPISLAAGGTAPPLSGFLSFLRLPLQVSSAAWLAIVGFLALGTLGSYRRHSVVFRCSLSIVIAGHLLLSLWYGANASWGQSLLLALLSAMVLLVPQWRLLPFEKRWTKIAICSTCMGVFLVLSMGLFIIHLMQRTMVKQTQSHLMNTATYGAMILTTTFDGIKTSMESMSQNPSLRDAVVQNDSALLQGLSRSFFESNHTMLRVGFLDSNGIPLMIYPPYTHETDSIGMEPFVLTALAGTTSLSTITDTKAIAKTPVISVATPIRSDTNEVIGVTIGMVDLYALTDILQQAAASEKEAYITVTDSAGTNIIHPDITLIGTTAQAAQAELGGVSVIQGYTDDGKRVMVADVLLSPLSMRISVMQPLTTVLPVGVMMSFLMVCTAIVYLIIMSMNMFFYIRREVPSGTSRRETQTQQLIRDDN